MHSEVNSCQVHLKTKATSRGSAKVIGTLRNIIDRNITNTISKLYGRYSVSIGRAETLQHAIFLFRRYCGRSDILKTLSSAAIRRPLPYGAHILEAIASGQIKGILDIQQKNIKQDRVSMLASLLSLTNSNAYMAFIQFLFHSPHLRLHQKALAAQKILLTNFKQYIGQYASLSFYKRLEADAKNWDFNVEAIEQFYSIFKDKINFNPRQKLFQALYQHGIYNNNDLLSKHACYQALQHLLTIKKDEFLFDSLFNVEELVDVALRNNINSDHTLQFKVVVLKYVEVSRFAIHFSNSFSLENVSQQAVCSLFENIQQRLQCIDVGRGCFLVHNVMDDTILKGNAGWDTIKLSLEHKYDVITADANNSLKEIWGIRIRYLSYRSWRNNTTIQLGYPQDLVSTAIQGVHIDDISQCINLESLFSAQNVYKVGFRNLQNLKRVVSYWDIYDNGNLLIDLFTQNKLEYVYIIHQAVQRQVEQLMLSRNIQFLRYFHVELYKVNSQIIINLKDEYPNKIKVCFAFSSGNQQNDLTDVKYCVIDGPQDCVVMLEKQLIHELKKNDQNP